MERFKFPRPHTLTIAATSEWRWPFVSGGAPLEFHFYLFGVKQKKEPAGIAGGSSFTGVALGY